MGWTSVGTIGGVNGANGVSATGQAGTPGRDGRNWLLGSAPPTVAQGNVGDLFFQSAPPGQGQPILIPGPQGVAGAQGPPGSSANVVINNPYILSGGLFFGPAFQMFPATPGAYTWVNQSTATAVLTGSSLTLTSSSDSAFNLYVKSIPTAPYTATALIQHNMICENAVNAASFVGLSLYNSATGWIVWYFANNGPANSGYRYAIKSFNTSSALVSTYVTETASQPALTWMRIRDDSTTRFFEASFDGINWITYFSHGNTVFLTPNKIGFFVFGGVGFPGQMSVYSYNETKP